MIKLFEQYNEYNQVKRWLDNMGLINYTINYDLTVDVDGIVNLSNKGLSEIPVQFNNVSNHFNCSNNKLTSLKGCPKYVGIGFLCNNNQLTSFEYCPTYVGGGFACGNNLITSFKDSPKHIGGRVWCFNNKISSLKYIAKDIENIALHDNPLPNEILDLTNDNISKIIKHQEDYGIWNSDNSFNKERFYMFQKDYEKGMLR